MKPYGTYKVRYRRASDEAPRWFDAPAGDRIETALQRIALAERRMQRVVDSLCDEIRGGDERSTVRIRRVFSKPREIFRVELERPDLGYQRTTLLGREALEALLESEDVRTAIEA